MKRWPSNLIYIYSSYSLSFGLFLLFISIAYLNPLNVDKVIRRINMNCKLSRASLIELQLIPTKSLNSSSLCPCCQQPVIEYRDQIGLGRIPFTQENLFPRVKRIFRKSVVMTIIVGAIVGFVVLALVTLINRIFTINEKNKQEKSFDILSHPYTHASIIDESKQHFSILMIPNDDDLGLFLGALSFCLFFSLALISLVLRMLCSRKSNLFQSKRAENNIKQEIPMSVKIYQSVSTQVP